MKRLLVFILVVMLIFSPRLFWTMKKEVPLEIAVIDKTVAKKDYREHNGLFQVLGYKKIVTSDGSFYDIGKDYYGFDPYDQAATPDYRSEKPVDMIYIADTYGVFTDDVQSVPAGERSELLYGGMDLLEWNAVMESKKADTILVAEFNSFASPTEEEVSRIMQKNVGVRWSGWIGRYFPDLGNDEVPEWMKHNYKKQTGELWNFDGEGIAFVDTDDKLIILDEKDMDGNVQFEVTAEGQKMFPKVKNSSYGYWFDIVEPVEGGDILANYRLELSDTGKDKIKGTDIAVVFPAVIHNEQEKTFYFAGDYADFNSRAFVKWQGFPAIYPYFAQDVSAFYWRSYFPMMSKILNEITNEKER